MLAFCPDSNILFTMNIQQTTQTDINNHFTLADSFCYDTHLISITEAEWRKKAFDAKAQVVDFAIEDLVQYFENNHLTSKAAIYKLKPRWSPPHLITEQYINSYTLSKLTGVPLSGWFHTQRLRPYIPLHDSTLDLIYPRDIKEPTEDELEVTMAEEQMLDDLKYPEAPQVHHG